MQAIAIAQESVRWPLSGAGQIGLRGENGPATPRQPLIVDYLHYGDAADCWQGLRAEVTSLGGVLVTLLPAFEMAVLARHYWSGAIHIDEAGHRELDTTGWQSFYTRGDIDASITRLGFASYSIEEFVFDSPCEMEHVARVYAYLLRESGAAALRAAPLFEHLLVAVR